MKKLKKNLDIFSTNGNPVELVMDPGLNMYTSYVDIFEECTQLSEKTIPELEHRIEKYMVELESVDEVFKAGNVKDEPRFSHIVSTYAARNTELLDNLEEIYSSVSNEEFDERAKDLSKLGFKDQYVLFQSIYFLIKMAKVEQFREYGIDLYFLKNVVLRVYENIEEYITIKQELEYANRKLAALKNEEITFYRLGIRKTFHDVCFENSGHLFIRSNDNLKCVFCGASTKEYDLTKADIDFLESCAKEQHILIDNAPYYEKDLPLIRTLVGKINYQIEINRPEDKDVGEHLTEEDKADEEYFHSLCVDAINDIQRDVKVAHKLDEKDYKNRWGEEVWNPKEFSDEKAKTMLEQIDKDIEKADKIEYSNPNRDLIIEMCKTRKYEILILSGKHIPTLYNNAPEEDKIAVIKAYYNLSDDNYRIASDYFEKTGLLGIGKALGYKCLTADQKIHTQITRMKIKRDTKRKN